MDKTVLISQAMKKRLVIEIKRGGLGDHLFYSHLPRIAKETNTFDEVFISNKSAFRSNDCKKLVWELNPFVDGFVDEKGLSFYPKKLETNNENILDRIMLMYGFDDGKRFHEPEIYYKPSVNNKWKNFSIYDPNFVSYTGDLKGSSLIDNWFLENDIKIDGQMKFLGKRYLPINCKTEITINSLFEFCDLIVSCKKIYCLTTGTATLAAALQVPVTVLYGSGHLALYRHSPLHTYINLGSNFTLKDKLKKQIIIFLNNFIQLGAA